MLEEYYQISYKLINPVVIGQIVFYWDLYKTGKNPLRINILWVTFLWMSPRLLTVFLMIYLLQNFINMVYQKRH